MINMFSKINRRLLFVPLILTATFINGCKSQEAVNEKIVKTILESMTLKEKAQLVIGTGMFFELPDSIAAMFPGSNRMADPNDSVYSAMVAKIRKFVPGAAGNTAEFLSKGITTQVLADGPAGLRIQPRRKNDEKTYYCTAFPIATVLSSTWDVDLVYKVGQAMGNEVLEYGVDILLAPGMNIHRDPLCGRNFEYYSEDPLITGKMAAAMVSGVQSNGVGTSIKHYAANNQETNRMSVNTIVSERALREIYLKGFEIAVKESQPWTVMSAYNKVNGEYASESHDLLTSILRNDWGFKGYVMTDWGGGSDVVKQMVAGNDLIMPGQPNQIKTIIDAVEGGKLDVAVLDKNVARILGIMLKSPKYKGYQYSSKPDLSAHAKVTRQAATDGMVLLENRNNTLPIKKDVVKIAAFGNTSYDIISGGTGSGDVNEAYTISMIHGLEEAGFTADSELRTIYEAFIKESRAKQGKSSNWLTALMGGKEPVAEMKISKELAQQMAGNNDIAIITIGRNSGEGGDRKPEEGDFYLNTVEKELIELVSDAFKTKGKKTVVILNIGGPIETKSWSAIPDAVLLAWQPGQEAGNSVMDVLTGRVNPSGRLPVTFPISYDDAPTKNNFPGVAVVEGNEDDRPDLSGFSFMRRVPWQVIYEEDIYVGYRYYNTFKVGVAYEFGYGLSYTSFEMSDLKLSSNYFKGKINVSVTVKNTGNVDGREVAQIYLSKPQAKSAKPVLELIAFAKTKLLKPGESQVLNFVVEPVSLASFNENDSAWLAEAGKYEINVGTSVNNIIAKGSFNLKTDLVVEKVSKALVPKQEINKLK